MVGYDLKDWVDSRSKCEQTEDLDGRVDRMYTNLETSALSQVAESPAVWAGSQSATLWQTIMIVPFFVCWRRDLKY